MPPMSALICPLTINVSASLFLSFITLYSTDLCIFDSHGRKYFLSFLIWISLISVRICDFSHMCVGHFHSLFSELLLSLAQSPILYGFIFSLSFSCRLMG